MREALGVEQFNNGRDRSDGHHDQMGQTIPVNANEKLRKKKTDQRKDFFKKRPVTGDGCSPSTAPQMPVALPSKVAPWVRC
jgi:hypothetical protein